MEIPYKDVLEKMVNHLRAHNYSIWNVEFVFANSLIKDDRGSDQANIFAWKPGAEIQIDEQFAIPGVKVAADAFEKWHSLTLILPSRGTPNESATFNLTQETMRQIPEKPQEQ